MKESLRRVTGTARRGVGTVCTPSGLRGAALEVAWIATHVALYPLGVTGERARKEAERFTLEGLPPVQRGLVIGDVEAAGTPILLVHGLVDNRSIFALLRRGLRRRGFGRVVTMNYSPFTADIRAAARRLAHTVEQLCEETGYERVHVVGHSLGGIIARYYVQHMGGDGRVHTLVTLGSPHHGTHAAKLLPTRVARQLRPGSELMQELAGPVAACRTRFLCFWSDLDQLIVPKRSARIEHPDLQARNVFVRAIGHMSLPIDGRIVHEICTTLAHLDHAGGTVTAGVTAIGANRSNALPGESAAAGRGRTARSPRRAGRSC